MRILLCSMVCLVLIAGCKETQAPAEKPADLKINPSKPKVHPPDPFFVATKDSIGKNGPVSIVRNLMQDKSGQIWFASWQGIMRFDGEKFYNHTLLHNLIPYHTFSLLEDHDGNKWFGSIGAGLYQLKNRDFIHYDSENGLVNNVVLSMAEDQNGQMWIGTDQGISVINGDQIRNYNTLQGLIGESVNTLMVDDTNAVWIGTNNGISIYSNDQFREFKKDNAVSFKNVRSIAKDKFGTVWIGSEEGFFRYKNEKIDQLQSAFTGTVYPDSKGNVWLSIADKNIDYDVGFNCNESKQQREEMAVICYSKSKFNRIYTSKEHTGAQTFGILEDREGNIWFGHSKGIGCYNGKEVNYFK